ALKILGIIFRRRDREPVMLLEMDNQVTQRERIQDAKLEQMIIGANLRQFLRRHDLLGQKPPHFDFNGIHPANPVHPVKFSNTTSPGLSFPRAAICRAAAMVVAASKQQSSFSSSFNICRASRISVSETRTAVPPVSFSIL